MTSLKDNKDINISKIPTVMSIKSHVISSPPPEESMAEIMKKIREDLTSKDTNNVETPSSVLKIQSPVKSHDTEVSDGMMDIVKKIRQDLDKTEKLTLDSQGPTIMSIKSNIKQLNIKQLMQVLSHVSQNPNVNEFSTNKPLKDSLVDFMKQVELMKENKNKSNGAIMSVNHYVSKLLCQ